MAATLIGFTGIAAQAQSPDSLLLLPLWDTVYTLRSGFGYKDNVFLSHTDAQGSTFVSGGGDVMILRVSPTGPQYNFFASGDANHYFSTSSSHNEYTAFAQAQVENEFTTSFKGSLAAEYFYQDQVLDVSFIDPSIPNGSVTTQSEPVRGHTITARPAVRLDLPQKLWLALESPLTFQYYQEPLDDYWTTGAKLTLGWAYGHNSRLTLSYEPGWRYYANDEALTETGAIIPGTQRKRFQQDALLTWRHYWDEAKHWRTTTKFGGRRAEENGGGFSDYTMYLASAQIQFRAARWEISGEARARWYDYDNQTVSPTDSTKLKRTDWILAGRIEREITTHVKFIIGFEREATTSNDPLESYTVNTASGSLQFEF